MAEITLPTFAVKNYTLVPAGGDAPIRFMGGSEQILQQAVTLWIFQAPLSLGAATEAQKRTWRAVLIQLSDLENVFKISPPDWPGNGAGYVGATPLVNGASQTGGSLICDGATINTAIALAGDYMEVNSELKILTADANSDGSGNVTFDFLPWVRSSPANNAVIDVKTPKVTLRAMEPNIGWAVTSPDIWDITLVGLEKFSNA